jgi:hypothetical protein
VLSRDEARAALESVTLSVGTPLCPYGVAYRRADRGPHVRYGDEARAALESLLTPHNLGETKPS